MRRAFHYRLWTNANQERELGIMLESHRRLYNACLQQRKMAYESEQRLKNTGKTPARVGISLAIHERAGDRLL
jgi:hypothetical protein